MDLRSNLEQKFKNPFFKGLVSVDGFSLSKTYEEKRREIDNLNVDEEDVWICTFPKSGTTWTQEMVWMILNNLNFEKGKANLDVRTIFLEISLIFDQTDFRKMYPDYDTAPFKKDSVGQYKNMETPRVVKSHLPFDLLPRQIRDGSKKPKIIYVARDPRDCCISYFHHNKLSNGFTGNLEEYSELFLTGKVLYGPYWKHVLPFWNMRNSPNVLFLKYDDMKENLPDVIKEVSSFLHKPLGDEQINVLSTHLSFESMKINPAVNRKQATETFKKLEISSKEDGGGLMRRGQSGGYKNEMSPEVMRKFEGWIRVNTRKTDYTC